jgi:pimeloyl-ACP methyl ester carboxylesterase
MLPKWSGILRVAAFGFALMLSTGSLPMQAQEARGKTTLPGSEPTSSGYAEAAEGLRVYYETYGEGEPIVVLAGGLMPIRTTAQITGPLSERRRVIAIDLEGHGRTGLRAVSGALAEQMKATPIFEGYGHPDQFPLFLDRMGELMSKDWDWREEVRALRMPVLLIFADHDSVSMQHIAEFFALFGGGIREPGWIDPQFSRARLAIIPGYSHYNLGQGPEVAQVIEGYLTQPTSQATQFTP